MSLYEKVQNAKRNDRKAMEDVLMRLEPKIRHTIHSIEKKYQEDVEQEVKLRVLEAVRGYDLDNLPSLTDMLDKTKEGRMLLERIKNDNSSSR